MTENTESSSSSELYCGNPKFSIIAFYPDHRPATCNKRGKEIDWEWYQRPRLIPLLFTNPQEQTSRGIMIPRVASRGFLRLICNTLKEY